MPLGREHSSLASVLIPLSLIQSFSWTLVWILLGSGSSKVLGKVAGHAGLLAGYYLTRFNRTCTIVVVGSEIVMYTHSETGEETVKRVGLGGLLVVIRLLL